MSDPEYFVDVWCRAESNAKVVEEFGDPTDLILLAREVFDHKPTAEERATAIAHCHKQLDDYDQPTVGREEKTYVNPQD